MPIRKDKLCLFFTFVILFGIHMSTCHGLSEPNNVVIQKIDIEKRFNPFIYLSASRRKKVKSNKKNPQENQFYNIPTRKHWMILRY